MLLRYLNMENVYQTLFSTLTYTSDIAKLYHLYELLFSDEGCMHGTPWA